jgi:hypothetical protein
MATKTALWELRPWVPYINTSDDPAMLKPPACRNIENRVTGVDTALLKRGGINKDWDSGTSGSDAIVGASDFWYLSGSSKLQTKVALKADGSFQSYDPDDGTITALTNAGIAVTTPTIASMLTFNSRLIMAIDGATNRVKKYSGSGNVEDLRALFNHTTVSRASSGTTRTLVLDGPFKGSTGDSAVITGVGGTDYNGTFTITSVSTTTLPNDTIQYTSVNLAEGTTADTGGTVHGLAPNGHIVGEHQGRLLLTEKGRPDRLHYSETGNHEIWWGYGDSGVIDLTVGDNDQEGISGIFPTFNGDLFVAKKTKLYRIRGLIPYHSIEVVSNSLGCVSHESIAAIDKRDIIWASEKGIHSLATTEKYGDYEDAFISKDIQRSFNDDWTQSRKRYLKGRYDSSRNLYYLGVTEEDLGTKNNCVWVYNVDLGKWISRWPNIACETIFIAKDSDGERPYFGSDTGRVYKAFSGDKYDKSETGSASAISFFLRTGKIFVTENPYQTIGFKKGVLYYTPRGTQTLTMGCKIDKFAEQNLSFDQSGGGTALGASFTLGTSVLGSEGLHAPYERDFLGYGRGVEITLSESSQLGDFAVIGLGIEYQPMGVVHAVNTGS